MNEETWVASPLIQEDLELLLLPNHKRSYASSRQVVFIDSRVTDYWTLVDRLSPSAQVFIIDCTSDGLSQVASALEYQIYIKCR